MRAVALRQLADLLKVAASVLRMFSQTEPKRGYVSLETQTARKIEEISTEVENLGSKPH